MSPEPRERTLELDRLVNFSDAVFAIAATVLVLSISFSLQLKPPDLDRSSGASSATCSLRSWRTR
jgi:uncharacterized membrane protein